MERQLAQLRPTSTSAEVLFTIVDNDKQYLVKFLNICNVGTSPTKVSVFHDIDGTTYDETTAIMWQHSIDVGCVVGLEVPMSDYQIAGNLAVQSSAASGANFTAYGEIPGESLAV